LVISCKNGHLDSVKYLVEKGTDINAYDSYPLYGAVKHGWIEIVEYLISKGADLKSIYRLYFCSIFYNKVSLINYFSSKINLESVCNNVELKDNIEIIFNRIVKKGYFKSVKIFLQYNNNIGDESTILLADKKNRVKIIKYLLNSKLEYYKQFDSVKDMIKKRSLIEYYDDFNIFGENFIPNKNDILQFIKNTDIVSLKKCFNYDFESDDYDLFFTSLLTKNMEIVNIIYNFIDNKENLKPVHEKIKCVFDNEINDIFNNLV
jgi:hypothetical protein